MSFVDRPGMDAITAAKMDEYATEVAIDHRQCGILDAHQHLKFPMSIHESSITCGESADSASLLGSEVNTCIWSSTGDVRG